MNNSQVTLLQPYRDSVRWSNKILRGVWILFSFLFFRLFPGPFFRYWRNFILVLWGAKLGKHCSINARVTIYQPWQLELDDYVAIDRNVRVYNCAKIKVGSKVAISQNAFLCTAGHDYTKQTHPLITAPITIFSQAWIAADAFIGMGVTIGEGAVVGARACVFKDVEPWTVVGGNPARFIKKRELTQ